MPAAVSSERVAALRSFNRFHTNVIGALQDRLARTPFTLTEARVLYELAQAATTEVRALRGRLDIDAGYLSRILAGFVADGLVHRRRSDRDGRKQIVELTSAGRRAFATLDLRAARAAADLLAGLTDPEQRRLLASMSTVRTLLDREATHQPDGIVLRAPEPGDFGWIVARHGELYAAEHGWNARFEGLVARIVADFLDTGEPGRTRAWLAERDGQRLGSICCSRRDAETAQLRLLLVEPAARGSGLGTRLVEECLAFAGTAGYQRIVLWTYGVLAAARRIYQRAGFTLVEQVAEHAYGHDLVGQLWARDLQT